MIDTAAPVPARRRFWWVAGVLAVLIAAAGTVVAVRSSGTTPPAAVSSPAAPAPVLPLLPRPPAGAPVSDQQAWVAQEAQATLKLQTDGLLAGDQAKFASNALPGAAAELGRRFRTLRSLRVTRFEQSIDGQPFAPATAKGDWRVVTVADHCLVEPECAADHAVFATMWRVTPQGLRFAGFRPFDHKAPCNPCDPPYRAFTRPWETTELVAQVGKRTVVAVPLAYRQRLADVSRRAEAAAAVADRYGIGDAPVDRYRVFVADPASWKGWYSGFPGTWVAGRATPTGPGRIEVSLLGSELTPGYADELLRHELAHVATLRNNTFYGQDDVWWLVEGMADYVQQRGAPGPYRKKPALRRLLGSRTLRSVAVPPPADDATDLDAAGRYAVGYYALDHLIAKYGKKAALEFFRQAVQFGLGLDAASRSALGRPWSQVDRDCAAAVRRA